MKIFALVPILLAWLPEIIKAVAIFEAILDPKTPGSEKKAAVMAYLSEVAAKSKLPWGQQAVEIIGQVIDTVVGILNFLGKFRHKADVDPAELEAASAAAVPPAETAEKVAKVAAEDEALAQFLAKSANTPQ
jgi:hypothetical protein